MKMTKKYPILRRFSREDILGKSFWRVVFGPHSNDKDVSDLYYECYRRQEQYEHSFNKNRELYLAQFKEMLLDLKQIYDSKPDLIRPDRERIESFNSFIRALHGFRTLKTKDGRELNFESFHDFFISFYLKGKILTKNCKYIGSLRYRDNCSHPNRQIEEIEYVCGPSDYIIHSSVPECEGTKCGKFENKWGDFKTLDEILKEIQHEPK